MSSILDGNVTNYKLLLIFQKDSNLISVIASVIPHDTYATTFLVKLMEILMCSDFIIIWNPVCLFQSIQSLCFPHSVCVLLPNPTALVFIQEGHIFFV